MLYPITATHYLVLGAAMLAIGTIGVLARRNIVVILMAIELILNAVNINLIAFAFYHGNLTGQVFALFTMALAAAEVAVGLGIILVLYRNFQDVDVTVPTAMRW